MANFYVASAGANGGTGSDSNNGALGTPWLTLAHSVATMAAGDTLFIRGGGAVYAEFLNNAIPGGVDDTHRTTLIGFAGDPAPVVQPNTGGSIALYISTQAYITLQNFIVDGTHQTTANNGAIKISYATSSSYAHHINLTGMEIRNMPAGSGVLVTGSGAGAAVPVNSNKIQNCNIHNCGNTVHHHLVYLETTDNIVSGNTLQTTSGLCVQIYNSDGVAGDTTRCARNQVHENLMSGGALGGVTAWFGDANEIYNNLIFGCSSNGGVEIDAGASNTGIYFNTIYNCSGAQGINIGLVAATKPTNTIVKDNICYSNSPGDYKDSGISTVSDYNLTGDATGVGAHTLVSTNPKFVNPAANDFHLLTGSPCIGAGLTITSPAITADYAGITRLSPPSMGALEFITTQVNVTARPGTQMVSYFPVSL